MRRLFPVVALVTGLVGLPATPSAQVEPPVYSTYLWHLEQPIYWPGPNASGVRYQTAYDSLQAREGGAAHPENNLADVFGKDDRVAVYQYRVKDALEALLGYADAGAQVSYSGGLIENVDSLGQANLLGYSAGWANNFRTARGWLTSGGHPRLDVVQFAFHHALIPLVHPEVLRMELSLYRQAYGETWGTDRVSTGLFPSEMAFAEHVIPVLEEAGIEWVVVSNAHISRACQDYPFVAGSGGDNIPPPNRADVQNPAQGDYNRISIDRGVSPANAVPFAYRPHYARWVDPLTQAESRVIVVPAAQSESWQDGYSCFGVGAIEALAPHNDDPDHPMLVVLAHDGDNAFGGGYSYYHECTPAFVGALSGAGHVPTTIAQYLDDHPVDLGDVVHVESGAWVNADGDFGAPSFLNWNWPLVSATGQVDIATGWAEDERNWAVITAATNEVLHATAVAGEPNLALVYDPTAGGASDVDKAWHFLLGSLNSGYMYYGTSLDMELKPSVACNQAVAFARAAYAGTTPPDGDLVGPTVWLPQRYPDNPGGTNFGPLYGYREVVGPPDFWVWTFVHDVSGVDHVTLWVREDADGTDPIDDDQNQTYAGGPGVGEWVGTFMTRREFPTGNVYDNPEIDVSILPTVIADEYYAQVFGYRDVLLDYFVEAVDTAGNVERSPIQHVYVGSEGGGGDGGDPDGVHWVPARPSPEDVVTIYAPDPGWLHWGVNGWQLPAEAYWPLGTEAFGDGKSVETPLDGPDDDGFTFAELGPFDGEVEVTAIDFVIHGADGSWDNNGGLDYHIAISDEPFQPGDAADAGHFDAGHFDAGHLDAGSDDGGTPDAGGADADASDAGATGDGTGVDADSPAADGAGSADLDTGAGPVTVEPTPEEDEGCGCRATRGRTGGRGQGAGIAASLAALIAWRRRRRDEVAGCRRGYRRT